MCEENELWASVKDFSRKKKKKKTSDSWPEVFSIDEKYVKTISVTVTVNPQRL